MNIVKNFIKQHLAACLVAILFGALYFLPNVIVAQIMHTSVNRVQYNTEEIFSYGVKVREVMDGHWFDGDPYLFEYKNYWTTWDYYPLALLVGTFAKLISLKEPSPLFIWSDFFLPTVCFLIFYLLVFKITKSKYWGIFTSTISIGFTGLPGYLHLPKLLLVQPVQWDQINQIILQGFNVGFSRMFVPSLTIIFLATFLLLYYEILVIDNINRIKILAAGFSFGLLFYVYFYYWTFIVSVLVLSVVILWYGRRVLGLKWQRVIATGGIGLVVSIPHWFRYLILSTNLSTKDYFLRIGIDFSHQFRFDLWPLYLTVIALIIICWLLRNRLTLPLVVYFSSLLLTMAVVVNIQVLTGFNPQPDHWGSRVNIYILVFIGMSLLFFIFKLVKSNRAKKIVLLTAPVFIAIALAAQISYALTIPYQSVITDDQYNVFSWIDEHTPPEAVFVTPAYESRTLLPYLTHANVYLPMACLSLASDAEIIDRYMTVYRLFGIAPDLVYGSTRAAFDLGESVVERANYANDSRYGEIESNFSIFCGRFTKPEVNPLENAKDSPTSNLDTFNQQYEALKKIKVNFSNLKWRADYVFWGPGERLISKFDPGKDSVLKLIYSYHGFQIYQINRR